MALVACALRVLGIDSSADGRRQRRLSAAVQRHLECAGLRIRFELHARLVEDPGLDLIVMKTEQIERASNVVLLTCSLWRVALNLCADSAWDFKGPSSFSVESNIRMPG